MKFFLILNLLAAPAVAESRKSRLWHWSVAAVIASNAADAGSSIGRYEANPVLGRGHVGARAISIKAGVVGGSILIQSRMRRGRPRVDRHAAIVNFATSAAVGAVAIRNLGQ